MIIEPNQVRDKVEVVIQPQGEIVLHLVGDHIYTPLWPSQMVYRPGQDSWHLWWSTNLPIVLCEFVLDDQNNLYGSARDIMGLVYDFHGTADPRWRDVVAKWIRRVWAQDQLCEEFHPRGWPEEIVSVEFSHPPATIWLTGRNGVKLAPPIGTTAAELLDLVHLKGGTQ